MGVRLAPYIDSSLRTSEHQYLDPPSHILEKGDGQVDRTGVGTQWVFGAMCCFHLPAGSVPVLSTKRVYWKTGKWKCFGFLAAVASSITRNVSEISELAPACHMAYQYHVTRNGKLNCLLYQRTCDSLLGARLVCHIDQVTPKHSI